MLDETKKEEKHGSLKTIVARKNVMMVAPVEAEESAPERSSFEEVRKLQIQLSYEMKLWLEQDFKRITLKNKLVKLPCNPNVVTILENYFKTWATERLFEIAEKRKRRYCFRRKRNKTRNLESTVRMVRVCREVMDGIRISFDFTLPDLLLYNKEKEQYNYLSWFHRMGGINHQFSIFSDSTMEEDLQYFKIGSESDNSEPSPETQFIILHMEQEEEIQNEEDIAQGDAVIGCSHEESKGAEENGNIQTLGAENEITESDPAIERLTNNIMVENKPEYWEIQPEIHLETSTDDNSDNSPLKNESIAPSNLAPCEVSGEPDCSVTTNTNPQNVCKKTRRRRRRSPFPKFLTRVTKIKTRSMSKKNHSITRVEMAKFYAILSDLLEKPFAPPNPDTILPSCLYGPVHLARLFVKLPDVLETSNASKRKLKVLSHHLHMFLSYLQGHPQWFDEENYQEGPITPAILYPSSGLFIPMHSFMS